MAFFPAAATYCQASFNRWHFSSRHCFLFRRDRSPSTGAAPFRYSPAPKKLPPDYAVIFLVHLHGDPNDFDLIFFFILRVRDHG